MKLFLKGERCFTDKCAIEQREYPPGQHGQGRVRTTEYRIHLREKQKVRCTYGVSEAQFRKYYDMAKRHKASPGSNSCSFWRGGSTISYIVLGSRLHVVAHAS